MKHIDYINRGFILYDKISYMIFCISGAILLINLFTYNYFGIWTTIISFLIMFNVLILRLVAFAYLDDDDDDDEFNYSDKADPDEMYPEDDYLEHEDFKLDNFME